MDTVQHATLAGLRDFFLSQTGDDLTAACALFNTDKETARRLEDVDWEQAEFAFNKLFVGPMALQAPPYASYYLEPEPQLMGESTLKIRRLYSLAGLFSPLQGQLPEDHLGVELDAALGFRTLAGCLDETEPQALWQYFFHDHLKIWLPKFLNQARNADTGHPVVDLALDRLETWFNDQEDEQEGIDQ